MLAHRDVTIEYGPPNFYGSIKYSVCLYQSNVDYYMRMKIISPDYMNISPDVTVSYLPKLYQHDDSVIVVNSCNCWDAWIPAGVPVNDADFELSMWPANSSEDNAVIYKAHVQLLGPHVDDPTKNRYYWKVTEGDYYNFGLSLPEEGGCVFQTTTTSTDDRIHFNFGEVSRGYIYSAHEFDDELMININPSSRLVMSKDIYRWDQKTIRCPDYEYRQIFSGKLCWEYGNTEYPDAVELRTCEDSHRQGVTIQNKNGGLI